MILIAYFSVSGVGQTGLSPKIDVWDSAANHPVNDQDMTEIAGGFYKYDFSTFDNSKDYCIKADGVSLDDLDRYVISTSESTGEISNILQVEKGNWAIKGNQMIFYEDDGTTELYKFNLRNKAGAPSEVEVYSRLGV